MPTASRSVASPAIALAGACLLAACSDSGESGRSGGSPLVPAFAIHGGPPPPSPLASASFGPLALSFWPYTSDDFGATVLDPINLLFVGEADVPNIRTALLALDGDRSAFGVPFDCTWRDAAGGLQMSWGSGDWAGSVAQLECGSYETVRFHLRLFPAGSWTAANAHFEVRIPGTTDHEVLSWNLAKQLVALDLQRTGLLDAAFPFGVAEGVTPSPTFRAIPPAVYNGVFHPTQGLPNELRLLLGLPPAPVAEPVGVPNDGDALIANLAGRATPAPGTVRYEFVIAFDQVIPKPICAASAEDWVHASGPIRFTHRVVTSPDGGVSSDIQVVGTLDVTPVQFGTWAPLGEVRRGQVADHYSAATAAGGSISSSQLRLITGSGGEGGSESQRVRFRVGPGGNAHSRDARCAD